MGGSTRRQNAVLVIVSAVFVAGSQGCTGVRDPVPYPVSRADVSLLPGARSWRRAAEGGGIVTVNTAPTSGTIADWDTPPAVATVYALLDNNGEDGKLEKRYQLKKKDDAHYRLVLSRDPTSTQTKWELVEVSNLTLTLTRHRSGHLWRCHNEHAATVRRIGFREDCTLPVEYDDEIASTEKSGLLARFASHSMSGDAALDIERSAIWISCNTGCCSLGR